MAETTVQTSPSTLDADVVAAVGLTAQDVLDDYRTAVRSRHASLLGRREVLTGKAKFGIFGDGKEVAQLAMARAFRPGDFRSGYYRDQTFMLALGLLTLEQFFAQLYAHADVSPTGSQMPRLVGLALASRLYRELPELQTPELARFSHHGDEIAFGTIGNASCAEGMFWEAVNAVGVLGAPMLLSIWDDGYGISVPNEHQITKGDLSAVLAGFRRDPGSRRGYELLAVKGWDYPGLCAAYRATAETVRREHVPAILHVTEVTQPQGHSTSGSHERYKSKERLEWEAEHDCLRRMRQWVLAQGIADAATLDQLEEEERAAVLAAKQRAWDAFRAPIDAERREVLGLLGAVAGEAGAAGTGAGEEIARLGKELERQSAPQRRDLLATAASALIAARSAGGSGSEAVRRLARWRREQEEINRERYSSLLYSETGSALAVPERPAVYRQDAPLLNGFEILNLCFDAALARLPQLVAMGEDVGQLGDVNQGFAGLQAKYGPLRVADTGIRETTIIGQAIGLALRGLRPLAEIQYLDYVLYALQILSDDLATLSYRTAGQQKAPVIVRTRGHRLEGIWHSGSPMAGLIHLLRGMWLCVPRNMTQAAGMYNTLLQADDPALVVEVLNGYRVKERLPDNIGSFTVPLGVPEVLRAGGDVTVVTYGACCRIALDAAELLAGVGIEAEVVDVQTLLPFDCPGRILASLQKTNRVLFLDEDVPGGASAYMLQQALEVQGGWQWLDGAPRTLTGQPHRPAYGSDGDYFSKPNREQVFEVVYEMLHEAAPARFPHFLK